MFAAKSAPITESNEDPVEASEKIFPVIAMISGNNEAKLSPTSMVKTSISESEVE